MKSSKKQWFYLNLGQKRGPVSKDKICDLIERKEIYYTDVQVWKEGMKEWLPVTEVRGFAGSIKKVNTPTAGPVDTKAAKEMELKEQDSHLSGLSRLGFNLYFYLGWPIAYFIGLVGVKELDLYGILEANEENAHWVAMIPFWVALLVSLSVVASRMRNAGYAGTWCLGLFVPILNLWVLLVSLCGPINYRRRRQLGMGGLVCFLVFVVVTLGTLLLNAGDHHINVRGMKEKAMELYAKASDMESRQNRSVSKRVDKKMDNDEEKREFEKTGRDGREKTKREAELEEATKGLLKKN